MRTQAIVLRKIDTGEYDQLVTCYTKDFGKLRVVAKGYHKAHSKLRNHLDEGDLIDAILISGKYRLQVRSVLSIKKYLGSQEDIKQCLYLTSILELFDRGLFENQPDKKLWEFIKKFLNFAENGLSEALLCKGISKFWEISGTPFINSYGLNTASDVNAENNKIHGFFINTLSLLNKPAYTKNIKI